MSLKISSAVRARRNKVAPASASRKFEISGLKPVWLLTVSQSLRFVHFKLYLEKSVVKARTFPCCDLFDCFVEVYPPLCKQF